MEKRASTRLAEHKWALSSWSNAVWKSLKLMMRQRSSGSLEQDMAGIPHNYVIGIAVLSMGHKCTFFNRSHCNKFILFLHKRISDLWLLRETVTGTPMMVSTVKSPILVHCTPYSILKEFINTTIPSSSQVQVRYFSRHY